MGFWGSGKGSRKKHSSYSLSLRIFVQKRDIRVIDLKKTVPHKESIRGEIKIEGVGTEEKGKAHSQKGYTLAGNALGKRPPASSSSSSFFFTLLYSSLMNV